MLIPNKSNWRWLLISVALIGLDLWTKNLASSQLIYGRPVEVLPMFNLVLQHNPGAAFSFLADLGGAQVWLFSIIAIVVSVVMVVWLGRLKPDQRLLSASLAFIVGGAIGNVWGRIELGYVVDFISLHYQSSYFPTFNIADIAINIGAGLMILDIILNPEKAESESEKAK
ncbi:prolipoprotein signal peptidase (Signal peptidase II.) [marine gamma proteobacterium HTCC2143]|jgi:signal peptidase II|uniref:Lipoprotein signal peptidase n=1 Tax=marine gamma proteobacterium HTCC2143 TaxID=247633 RepID=A0YDV8_9GAMM|nr:prolipoprotein signal peptidase (Signal peptidase II.) [marine gamma proteobacterium HTCC2143]